MGLWYTVQFTEGREKLRREVYAVFTNERLWEGQTQKIL
jgi:hypothetical protein